MTLKIAGQHFLVIGAGKTGRSVVRFLAGYGARVRVDVVQRLRETRKFASPAELVAQLGRDETDARAALAATPLGIGPHLPER